MGFMCCGFMIGGDDRPKGQQGGGGGGKEPLLQNKAADPKTPVRPGQAPPALSPSPGFHAPPSPKARPPLGYNVIVHDGAGGELPAPAAGTTNLPSDQKPSGLKAARLRKPNPCTEASRLTYDAASGKVA